MAIAIVIVLACSLLLNYSAVPPVMAQSKVSKLVVLAAATTGQIRKAFALV
jgi:hypothetical protein